MRLAGEKAVVTGSTSGLGRAIATTLAAEGAAVVVTGRDQARGDAVVADIAAAGGAASFVAAELGDERACTNLVETAAERMGGLTVLVNNAAGAARPTERSETSPRKPGTPSSASTSPPRCGAARRDPAHATRGPRLHPQRRRAVRPSGPSPGFTAYIAAKSGLNGLTRAIAVDYADDAIRCNTISPGYVLNDRRDADITPERRARYEGMHLTRLGVASDIAHAAVYLASRESEFVTGINLQLDGGSSIARGLTLG